MTKILIVNMHNITSKFNLYFMLEILILNASTTIHLSHKLLQKYYFLVVNTVE